MNSLLELFCHVCAAWLEQLFPVLARFLIHFYQPNYRNFYLHDVPTQ